MSKYRLFLSLIVLVSSVVITSADFRNLDSHGPNTNLLFVNPMGSDVDPMSSIVFGDGSYKLETGVYGEITHVNLAFWDLTPRKSYVLWCITMSVDTALSQHGQPCKSDDGQEITVRADVNGNAVVAASIPAMQTTNDTRLSMIALAYDLEGYTYGAPRGDIAVETRIETFAILPALD